MSGAGLGKCTKIRHIVQLRQMVRRWRQKAAASRQFVPSDVPSGHVAVSVGSSARRFIIRTAHLNHPMIRRLLAEAEEEYGFANQDGPLSLPCDDLLFEHILRFISRQNYSSANFVNLEDLQTHCHVGICESWPLLPQKSIR